MNKFLKIILFCTLLYYHLDAQILPKENSKLNYRLVGFSFPGKRKVNAYKVEIATGTYTNADSFEHNVAATFPGEKNKIIGIVPSFGKEYTWQVTYTINGGKEITGELHHFSTTIIPQVDTDITRMRVVKKAEKYKDAYILADGTGVMYDMSGAPLWYLPGVQALVMQGTDLMDLQLSVKGTITYIHADQVYEADYNGKILWQGPNTGKVTGGKTEDYHHQFTRLNNGHYMTMGREYVMWNTPTATPADTVKTNEQLKNHSMYRQLVARVTGVSNPPQQNIVFGVLIEYDSEGNVVWTWRSSDYAKKSDLYNLKTGNWRYDINDLHENAFFFDEEEKTIYLSYRNLSRVIKIKYPEGNVMDTYGEIYQPGLPSKGNDLFCHQHACRRSAEGYLYLYNNDDCYPDQLPKLMMFKEPAAPGDTLKKIWEYECTIEGMTAQVPRRNAFMGGGSVLELPGGELFANMDSRRYNKAFIVNMDKQVLWSALFEQWDASTSSWKSISNYRVSIITDRKALEALVWNQEVQ